MQITKHKNVDTVLLRDLRVVKGINVYFSEESQLLARTGGEVGWFNGSSLFARMRDALIIPLIENL